MFNALSLTVTLGSTTLSDHYSRRLAHSQPGLSLFFFFPLFPPPLYACHRLSSAYSKSQWGINWAFIAWVSVEYLGVISRLRHVIVFHNSYQEQLKWLRPHRACVKPKHMLASGTPLVPLSVYQHMDELTRSHDLPVHLLQSCPTSVLRALITSLSARALICMYDI